MRCEARKRWHAEDFLNFSTRFSSLPSLVRAFRAEALTVLVWVVARTEVVKMRWRRRWREDMVVEKGFWTWGFYVANLNGTTGLVFYATVGVF